jgi:hypothetical protein
MAKRAAIADSISPVIFNVAQFQLNFICTDETRKGHT